MTPHRIHATVTILALALAACGGNAAESPELATAEPTPLETSEPGVERKNILFYGDSITAGYGLDPELAFPALIQEFIDDRGWPFNSINGGLSGETSAGGLRRIDWMLRQPVDVFVLELGGNDGLRGVSVSSTRSNLIKIVERVREENPDVAVILAGMRIPPNLGRMFAERFAAMYPEVAEETGAVLIPFLGEDVIGRRTLVQMDGIHPTAAGHEVLAETVWEFLEPVLQDRLSKES